jgi:hypothetical protein
MSDEPRGSGPLAGDVTGGPIDDPALADRANPRWEDPTSPEPDAQPLTNPDGSPNVLPPDPIPQQPGIQPDPQGDPLGGPDSVGDALDHEGTPQDQAAQVLEGELEVGKDNIRLGLGDTQPNPALAEGGDNG